MSYLVSHKPRNTIPETLGYRDSLSAAQTLAVAKAAELEYTDLSWRQVSESAWNLMARQGYTFIQVVDADLNARLFPKL